MSSQAEHEPPLLRIRGLTTTFETRRGPVRAVDGIDLDVTRGQILGIVGESGCGKSTLLRSIMGLVSKPGRCTGSIEFGGRDLLRLSGRELRDVRGRLVSMIFQDPLSTLNPVVRIGPQILEVLNLHEQQPRHRFGSPRRDRPRRQRVIDAMAEVGISDPEERFSAYPHEFSGGMQQRALIAMGLVARGDLLLADEPTTALDVTIQAQIIDLLTDINSTRGTTIVIVTHDLGLAAEFCDSIAVMYAGRIVEHRQNDDLIDDPRHPYTKGLFSCIPQPGQDRIEPIPGLVADLSDLGPGCAFAPRCGFASQVCLTDRPATVRLGDGGQAECHHTAALDASRTEVRS